ncbi:vpr protein [Simian immunodeficiency virus]|uniref:Vpr protein n=1 Tax=Simian immunodeficiency virus TaxID=11723 RepID=A4UDF6_SIV|nr:vpr protein [Simian immunodeficiency virus]
MEQAPPSHPLSWLSRQTPTTMVQAQAALWELNEEAEKHFSRDKLRGIWDRVTELPADPQWSVDQAAITCAIDYIKSVQTLLFRHYRDGCYHSYAQTIRRYPPLRPLRGTQPPDSNSMPNADPTPSLRPSRYRMDE